MVFCNISWDGEAEEKAILKGFMFWGVWVFVLEQISQKLVDMDELQLAVLQAKNLTRLPIQAPSSLAVT